MSHVLNCKYYRLGQASQTFCSTTPFFEKRFLCDQLAGSLHVNDVKTINVQLQTLADLETNFVGEHCLRSILLSGHLIE